MKGITISGARQLNRQLRRIEKNALAVTHRELRHAAEEVAAKARELAPVDTGFTRESIGVHPVDDEEIEIIAASYYAPWLEFGTEKMAPRPFMRPAVDAVGYQVIEGVARKIGRTIDFD